MILIHIYLWVTVESLRIGGPTGGFCYLFGWMLDSAEQLFDAVGLS